jgi:hypothetical protein
MARFAWISLACAVGLALAGCSDGATSSNDDLTGTTAEERPVTFTSYVYVDPQASDGDIAYAIAREIKTALGALRDEKVAFDDRGAQSNVDPSKWTRTLVDVYDPSTQEKTGQVLKVTYPYADKAVVTKSLDSQSAIDFTMLAGDYGQHADTLKQSCSDDPATDTDSLWYHFQPSLGSCQSLIDDETSRIQSEQSKLSGHAGAIGPSEAGRWFQPVTAKLGPKNAPKQNFSPEYDRLFGVGTDKSQLIVYAFFGVDTDETDPDDILGQEAFRFLRTMLAAQPNFRVVYTNPQSMLLDFWVGQQKLANVSYDDVFRWVLDKSGYPSEVGSDPAKIDSLRRQAAAKLAERWIYWDLPIEVKDSHGDAQKLTVEVRSFYGYEDGSPDARQHAQWRYLEAFWYGDVFLYNGHSHFGHGPLEPNLYGPQNFNDRYQIMLVNSCLSYNYYHEDFLAMKPGGSKNLEIVVNGSPSYVWGGGEATANFLTGLLSGKQLTYVELLNGTRIDLPWGEKSYDPMRVVDGELDNVYSRTKTPLTLTVLPALY